MFAALLYSFLKYESRPSNSDLLIQEKPFSDFYTVSAIKAMFFKNILLFSIIYDNIHFVMHFHNKIR